MKLSTSQNPVLHESNKTQKLTDISLFILLLLFFSFALENQALDTKDLDSTELFQVSCARYEE
jgi:hypothetical protein